MLSETAASLVARGGPGGSVLDALVVGGGISGLATAWWLRRAGAVVELWERDARAGGRIGTDRAGGWVTERAATMIVGDAEATGDLVAGTDLAASVEHREEGAARYLVGPDGMHRVPTTLRGMITSPLWSGRAKLRMLAEPFIPAGGDPNETVSEMVVRRLGRELLDNAIEPYVAGPLASDPDRAEAATTLPRMKALERRYGSLTRGVLAHRRLRRRTSCAARPLSFAGGMQTLVDAVAATVRPVRNMPAKEIWHDGETWHALAGDGRKVRAHHIVLCTPAPAAAALLEPIEADLADLLDGIEHSSVGVVHLGFRRTDVSHPLDGAGLLTTRSAKVEITGCLWASSAFAGRTPPGFVLLSAYLGGARHPRALEADDAGCIQTALDALEPLVGLRGSPHRVRVDRHARAMPLYCGAYSERLASIDRHLRGLPGLHLVGAYRGGVSVRDRLACARETASIVLGDLALPRTAAGGAPRHERYRINTDLPAPPRAERSASNPATRSA